MDLVSENFVEDNVLCAPEKVLFHLGIGLFEFGDQSFGLEPLGTDAAVLCSDSIFFRKTAGALKESQMIKVSPGFDVLLTDQVHRPDQLHSLEICAPEFGHHRLVLSGVQHSHEDRLDDVIIMMAERDLVAAQFFGLSLQISPSHSRTEIAGGFFYIVDRPEDGGVEDRDRNPKDPAVFFDELPVRGKITGIHADE